MRSRISSLVTLWYRLTHPVYLRFWRWFQPVTVGVKIIAVDPADRVLLVKTRYQKWWSLPGGGVHRRETPEAAAVRELREETGIRIVPEDVSLAGLLTNVNEGKSDYIAVFAASVSGDTTSSPGIEIAETGWFPLDALPGDSSPATRCRLAEWREGRIMTGWWSSHQ
ncbi:MAG TPA: NUDIX domain-containing protein [Thermomicrobiales bacterium]|nr:NUDIX domain-containing protein [Thermomicrobiales bacterium]